jgi:hypothetical protein
MSPPSSGINSQYGLRAEMEWSKGACFRSKKKKGPASNICLRQRCCMHILTDILPQKQKTKNPPISGENLGGALGCAPRFNFQVIPQGTSFSAAKSKYNKS